MAISELKNNARTISGFCLDLIFPKNCVNCGEFGSFVCDKCLAKIKPIETQVCPKCGKIRDSGVWCPNCRDDSNLTGIIVAAKYRAGPTKEIIHHFKYLLIKELAPVLADLLIDQLIEVNFSGHVVITAVPLHRRKFNERGFNQAEVLGRIVGEKLGYNYQNLLRRRKNKKSQVELSGAKRRENLTGNIAAIEPSAILGKTVILLDDVATTGTTLEECAKILRLAGARRVYGLVVARG